MMSDLPHTLYKRKGDGKPKAQDVADAEAKTREAYERRKKRESSGEGFTLNEVFDGVADYVAEESAKQEDKQ